MRDTLVPLEYVRADVSRRGFETSHLRYDVSSRPTEPLTTLIPISWHRTTAWRILTILHLNPLLEIQRQSEIFRQNIVTVFNECGMKRIAQQRAISFPHFTSKFWHFTMFLRKGAHDAR
jgi:hypothetical protein